MWFAPLNVQNGYLIGQWLCRDRIGVNTKDKLIVKSRYKYIWMCFSLQGVKRDKSTLLATFKSSSPSWPRGHISDMLILAIGSGLKLKEFRVAPIEGN